MEPMIKKNGIHYALCGEQYYPGLFLVGNTEQDQYELIVSQMAEAMGVDNDLKERDPLQ